MYCLAKVVLIFDFRFWIFDIWRLSIRKESAGNPLLYGYKLCDPALVFETTRLYSGS